MFISRSNHLYLARYDIIKILFHRNAIWCSGVIIFLCVATAANAAAYAESDAYADEEYFGSSNLNSLAEIQKYQNEYDQPLQAHCQGKNGMFKVLSVHSDVKEDRVWNWKCRRVVKWGRPKCKQTNPVNNFDEPMFFMCGKNQYIGGVDSYHDDQAQDRRWSFSCCSARKHITASCRITEYANDFDQPMNFEAGRGEVITGVLSYHDNDKE